MLGISEFMWEEHPEYQKQQARLIGLLLAGIAVFYAGYAIVEHDWVLLKQVLLFTGAFIIALGLVFGFVWTLMKIFIHKRTGGTKIKDSHDA
jgi:hypothetical protein